MAAADAFRGDSALLAEPFHRIVLHLVNAMKRLGKKRGIATECIGGGQGGAMLIETVQ